MPETTNNLLAAALWYADLGYPVFPCAPGDNKPISKHGFKDASADPEQIEQWWARRPSANIGIPTHGLLALDVDLLGGEPNPWLTPERQLDLARAPMQLTPGGGRHYLFRQPEGKHWSSTVSQLAPKIDIRADGGYIVVPPSARPDGVYRWQETMALDVPPDQLPEPPAWLAEALDALAEGATTLARGATSAGEGNPIPSGQRNATLASLAGTMRRAGMTRAEILAAIQRANENRCRPPLPEREVQRVAASIARYAPDDVTVAVAENHWAQMAEADPDEPPPAGPADPGPFPERFIEVPGLIGRIIEYNLATAIKPQPVLALAGGICGQAVLVARKVRDARGNRTNVYVVGVAPSGRGKEHPRKVNKNILFHSNQGHLIGNEDFASDSGLLKAVEIQPAILFQIDEIGRLLKTTGDARSSHLYNIVTAFMKLYSAADTRYIGKAYADPRRNIEIHQPCVSLYGLTIPQYLYEALTVENLVDGFLARLMVFETEDNPPRQRVRAAPVPETILETARTWDTFKPGGNLASVHPDPEQIDATPEAGEVFDALADMAEAEPEPRDAAAQALWARTEEKACRLALIYACSANPKQPLIDRAAAEWACGLSEYLTRRMLFAASQWVSDGAFDAKQKKVLRILHEAGGSVTRSELYNRTRAWTKNERTEVLENMALTRQLVEKTEETGGRPKLLYALP